MKLRNFRVDVSFEDSKVARGVTYWNRYYNTHEPNGPVMYSAFVYGVRSRENAYRIVQKCHGSKIHRAGYVGASSKLAMKAIEIRKDGQLFGAVTSEPVREEFLELPRTERLKVIRKTARASTQKGKARQTKIKNGRVKAEKSEKRSKSR